MNFDERVGEGLRADAARKGVGIVDVIRIAASEYLDRRMAQSN